MRTIKFRGKESDGNWHYGDLEHSPIGRFCRIHEYKDNGYYKGEVDIDPATVGQFTGLIDKNGVDIYEGDIVQSESGEFVYQVVFNETRFASFGLKREQDMFLHYFGEAIEADKCEVIGNVFDNHELMEGGLR